MLMFFAEPAVFVPPLTPAPRPVTCADDCISPVEAVTYASYLAPKAAIAGTFRMEVKAVGEQRGFYYLNSETDYRDRNCLTIAMPARVMAELTGGEGLDAAEKALKGRVVVVRGVAERVKIGFFDEDGKATDKYYYQIQIRIGRPDQIAVRTAG
ncbi:hypothetical protein [Sphingopyxis sp. H115]|uniref:hypothetical protein n=1 Tax=Sphingopyxis sp. H115 TaxID=1759073 RepID=UPI00128F6311|nr:hypothetical protein [Sphingopyxis sp. H115]